jgi:heptaprenylglyceryl phosphate synthase
VQQLNDVVSNLKKRDYNGAITIVPSSLEHIKPLTDCRFGIPVLLNSKDDYDTQSQHAARMMFANKLKGEMYGLFFSCDSTAAARVRADPDIDKQVLAQRVTKHDFDALWLDFEGGGGVDLSTVSWFKQFNKKLIIVTDVWDKQTLEGLEKLGVDLVLLADVFKGEVTLEKAVEKVTTAIPVSERSAPIQAEYHYS